MSMKILFFIDGFRSGGKERRCIELLKGLKDNPQFDIHIVSLRKEIVYPEFYKLNYPYYLIEKDGKLDPIIFIKFYKICKEIKPDIVHCWSGMNGAYSLFAKILLKFKLINSQITDAPLNIKSLSRFGIQTKLNFHFSDLILSNSFAGLKSYNAPKEKSSVIYNGFDFNRIRNVTNKNKIKNRFNITTKYIVGMVASFSDKKDYDSYIKAAISILGMRSDISFLCIGSGDDKPFKEMVSKKIKGNIKFLGKQENVESIMNICDIGVLSTFTEGISNSIMEFMALGKPVIASNGGGTVELIINNKTGCLISAKSPQILEEKLILLLKDPKKRKMFGKQGKNRIEKKFGINRMVKDFQKTYKKIYE